MSKIPGRFTSLGISKEAVRGTAGAMQYWIPWKELKNTNDQVETVLNDTSLARLESSDGSAVVKKFSTIGWKTKMKDTHFGLLLLSLFGTDTPAAQSEPNTAVYDHVFTVAQSTQHQSLTLGLKDSNFAVSYAGAVVNSLKISAELGNYVMYECSTMGKPSGAASHTVAHVQENDFLPQHLTFKKATAQSGLTAASAITVRNCQINFEAPTMFEDVLGTTTPNDVLNKGDWKVSGSVTLVHNDTTFLDLMTGGTYNALRFDFIHTATIGTSAHPELKIDLHRCSFHNYERKMALNDIIEESFDFTAHYSLTDSKMATVTLSNLVTAYNAPA